MALKQAHKATYRDARSPLKPGCVNVNTEIPPCRANMRREHTNWPVGLIAQFHFHRGTGVLGMLRAGLQ